MCDYIVLHTIQLKLYYINEIPSLNLMKPTQFMEESAESITYDLTLLQILEQIK